MRDVNHFSALKIGLASPEQIRGRSSGEVKKPETINYRTLKPEKDGLFCEKIFGPTKDWECYCGKYKRIRFKGIICERCGVEVTRAKVRRDRMAHIELAAPVSHIWFFKGVPSRLGYLLDLAPKDLEKILYFASYMITHVDKDKIEADMSDLAEELEDSIAQVDVRREDEIRLVDEGREERLLGVPVEKEIVEGEEETPEEESDEPEVIELRPLKPRELKKLEEDVKKELKSVDDRTEHSKEVIREAFEVLKTLEVKQMISNEDIFRELRENYSEYFRGGMGAEAVKDLLKHMDLEAEAEKLKEEIGTATGQKRQRAVKRLKVVGAFRTSGNKPEWMILDVVPVIPPDLRPMVQLDGGRFATSDLNDLYRRVINRNNRLRRLLDLGAPEIIVNNEKRMLQEAVDALFDNGRRGRPVTGPGNRPLKSLSDMLKGKQGRFRQNLLGKRVDYSGRSVIVVGPNLKLHQCGLPKIMALELFKPFVMKRLVDLGHAQNIKTAKRLVERGKHMVWDVLEEVIREHPVLLNRAPTLHRLGIQAFEPILVEGKAIQIHPLVCTAFNADFDGDQMAVHLPLSAEAQAEARLLMLSSHNILSPAHGRPITTPTQDIVLGVFSLTAHRGDYKGYKPVDDGEIHEEDILGKKTKKGLARFASEIEVLAAWDVGDIQRGQLVIVRRFNGDKVKTTPGRIKFNSVLPEDYPYVNEDVAKKRLGQIISDCAERYDAAHVAEILDGIKSMGFHAATRGGITIGLKDVTIPPTKKDILKAPEEAVEKIEKQFRKGLVTNEERHQQVVDLWTQATDDVTDAMEKNFDRFNPIYLMATSGARGNIKQIRQLAGMRGLVSNPKGETIDQPIKANFREGLTVLEYFVSTHGARKGLADTALRTADSGYLTRRLVDVSQDVIIREDDCGTEDGIPQQIHDMHGDVNHSLYGRAAVEKVVDPDTGEVIVDRNGGITEKILDALAASKLETVMVRSVMTCEARQGICSRCYGFSLANKRMADIGEAVGIIAAQSIGEPGTQLTMRTFHTGGVVGADITHGLPRIVELFEARKPKGQAVLAEIDGKISIIEADKTRTLTLTGGSGDDVVTKDYKVPKRYRLLVSEGDDVKAGMQLTPGHLSPHDILAIKGIQATQIYLVQEVQEVYRLQGVEINDKHIEVIIRQMMKRVQVAESGDTLMLPLQVVGKFHFDEENDRARAEGGEPATAANVILGITKASLATDSYLSAASFQETTRVLTDAAIDGKSDPLLGLKENVIIGKLIPAATGMPRYRDVEVELPESVLQAQREALAQLLGATEGDLEAGMSGETAEGSGSATEVAVGRGDKG